MRTTRGEVEANFKRLVTVIGGRVAINRIDVGGYLLQKDYTGYSIARIMEKGGGITMPFGYRSLKASEFVSACQFAVSALEIKG